jgi:hypothetical protein
MTRRVAVLVRSAPGGGGMIAVAQPHRYDPAWVAYASCGRAFPGAAVRVKLTGDSPGLHIRGGMMNCPHQPPCPAPDAVGPRGRTRRGCPPGAGLEPAVQWRHCVRGHRRPATRQPDHYAPPDLVRPRPGNFRPSTLRAGGLTPTAPRRTRCGCRTIALVLPELVGRPDLIACQLVMGSPRRRPLPDQAAGHHRPRAARHTASRPASS